MMKNKIILITLTSIYTSVFAGEPKKNEGISSVPCESPQLIEKVYWCTIYGELAGLGPATWACYALSSNKCIKVPCPVIPLGPLGGGNYTIPPSPTNVDDLPPNIVNQAEGEYLNNGTIPIVFYKNDGVKEVKIVNSVSFSADSEKVIIECE